MKDKINLAEKLALLDDPTSPDRRLPQRLQARRRQGPGRVRLAQARGHRRLLPGALGAATIQLRDRDVELGPGELFVVPRGVEHCPNADEETHVLLIEPEARSTPATPAAT